MYECTETPCSWVDNVTIALRKVARAARVSYILFTGWGISRDFQNRKLQETS